MGFFNWVHFFIIFHVIALTTIFTVTDSRVTPKQLSPFLDLAKKPDVFEWMVRIRRQIHEYPELLFEEFKTTELIISELHNLNISYKRPFGEDETGVIGYIGTGNAPFVALRGDMDALPIQEMVEWEYKSKIPGKMHACGHDGHVAMVLGAAKILKEHEDELKGTVVLVFQPAEEGGAGAKKIVQSGVLDDVEAIFGLHVSPSGPVGAVAGRAGPIMAGSGIFEATIYGKGGHGAMPNLAIDPMVAASSTILSLQQLVSREADPLNPWVVSVGNFYADGAFNVIQDSVKFGGTFRALANFDNLVERIEQVVTMQAAVQRCTGVVDFHQDTHPFYPVTNNDAQLHKFFVKVANELFVDDPDYMVIEAPQTMGSEDFSFYQEVMPGYFYVLGLQGPGEQLASLHSPYFTLNEDALPYGAAVHVSLIASYLENYEQLRHGHVAQKKSRHETQIM